MTKEERLLELVASYAQIPAEEIKSKTRKNPARETRHMAMYIFSIYSDLSVNKIAKYFNRISHATAINAINKTKDQLEIYEQFREKWYPLLYKAKELADIIQREESDKLRISGYQVFVGDICWFWTAGSEEFPRLGTLLSILPDQEAGKDLFTAAEFSGSFDSCVYAGEYVLPKQYLQWRDKSLSIA